MKTKQNKTVLICQFTPESFMAVKYASTKSLKKGFLGYAGEALSSQDDESLKQAIKPVFARLKYNHDPVIISLPSQQATCRFLKIPSQDPKEIERIVYLQASQYLPCSIEDLAIGYQIISCDKEGYASVNLIIVHQKIIARYLKVLNEFKPEKISIVLSSYGLCNYYHYAACGQQGTVMVIDIDSLRVELIVIVKHKLLFSRSFKVDIHDPRWQDIVIDEVKKVQGAYLKRLSQEDLDKIVVVDTGPASRQLADSLTNVVGLPVELSTILADNKIATDTLGKDRSLASLVGFGLESCPETLNLLPHDVKREINRTIQRKELFRAFLSIPVIIVFFGLGIVKTLQNKADYLDRLKLELNKIKQDALPLVEIDKKLQLIKKPKEGVFSIMEMFLELSRIMPQDVFLNHLSYEEKKEILLRGQAPALNLVSEFVTRLQSFEILKGFDVKLKYATQRKSMTQEGVVFEIACLKKGFHA